MSSNSKRKKPVSTLNGTSTGETFGFADIGLFNRTSGVPTPTVSSSSRAKVTSPRRKSVADATPPNRNTDAVDHHAGTARKRSKFPEHETFTLEDVRRAPKRGLGWRVGDLATAAGNSIGIEQQKQSITKSQSDGHVFGERLVVKDSFVSSGLEKITIPDAVIPEAVSELHRRLKGIKDIPVQDDLEVEYIPAMDEFTSSDTEEEAQLPYESIELIQRLELEQMSTDQKLISSSGLKAVPKETDVKIKARAYQHEMFEESLNRNIIVCQETGSGKTFVAILRIQHEIYHSPSNQISWFLVPNRFLAEQQFQGLQKVLQPVPMKLLTGNDGLDKWNSTVWTEILKFGKENQVRVVVSTYQVLYDALCHAYVTMNDLSLIVFDEAHHCIRDHPANKIMKDFYHPRRRLGENVPAILGLTASPLFNKSVDSLHEIESNLNAICRTPTLSRAALEQHSRRPTLKYVAYASHTGDDTLPSASFPFLDYQVRQMRIEDDPYVKSLQKETERERKTYEQVINSEATYCMQEMKAFLKKCEHIIKEYGGCAGDFYVHRVIERFSQLVHDKEDELVGWVDEEKVYLLNILIQVKTFEFKDTTLTRQGALSPKLEKLIDVLVKEYDEDLKRGGTSFSGIIFVEQRVSVAVLAEILSRHPKTKSIFRCGTLVGCSTSASRSRKSLAELADSRATTTTLADFRSGKINLLIATSVAEEGLDIQACHLVVCCYLQKNKKSYIQMRGRARRANSTYVLMFENIFDAKVRVAQLDSWEKEMEEAYRDQHRELKEKDEEEEFTGKVYEIPETGALLTYDTAIPHLHHFCAVIPHSQYDDFRPDFHVYRNPDNENLWTAELTLPSCIPPELRTHKAESHWKTEKMAKRDVAFVAYMALYRNELVDNHWMPLPVHDPELELDEIAKKSSTTEVPLQIDPFERPWKTNSCGQIEAYSSLITIQWQDGETTELKMFLPFPCPHIGTFQLWWTDVEQIRIKIQEDRNPTFLCPEEFGAFQRVTYNLFSAVFWGRIEKESMDFSYLFCPVDGDTSLEKTPVLEVYQSWSEIREDQLGIVRDKSQMGKLYLFKAWNRDATLSPDEMQQRYPNHEILPDVPLLEVTPVPRRRNFLHSCNNNVDLQPVDEDPQTFDNIPKFLLPQVCTFDKIPWKSARATLLLPCILRRLEIFAIAQELQETVLAPVRFHDVSHLVTAITASCAGEDTNYQRYELLGDSVLKFLSGIQLLADFPLWHEGYLSGKKDRTVANSKLAEESVRLQMSRFIITKHFNARKWKPKYILLPGDRMNGEQEGQKKRSLSTKMLADIVESLMGAAYLEGSFDKALKVAEVFGLGLSWKILEYRLDTLYERAITSQGMHFPPHLHQLEDLIGYHFNQKSLLLEAITHPGCNIDTTFVSYQRMEFLGDSVLDMVIVDKLFRHANKFSHVDMHLYKSASVTADFLAFLCLNLSMTVQEVETEVNTDSTGNITLVHKSKTVRFLSFLRHQNAKIYQMQEAAYKNYQKLKEDIFHDLQHCQTYPWTKLAGLNAEKFFSDMIESILGAVFVDSHGNWEAVHEVLSKLGLINILNRLVDDRVDPRHPVTKLGMYAARKLNTVKYTFGAESNRYTCTVYVSDEEIVKVGNGISAEEVRTRAAETAYLMLVDRELKGKEPDTTMTDVIAPDLVAQGVVGLLEYQLNTSSTVMALGDIEEQEDEDEDLS
ncbi:hypothetical protein BDZ91DRAFT_721433 [Kalaharituber pfeilii]|nr:hypothetical protein BDZ91DRAFT_721433 [Kalaharituber pfeilii]